MPKDPHQILSDYWGFSSFKGSQEQIINTLLAAKDVLALLPTGGGKSLCYQIPALASEGICIVVSPLIALIQDQVGHLKKRGIKALSLTGGIPFSEVSDLLDNCIYGNYKFLYLSPERLQQELVKDRIQQMNVNLIAIDEAHCISQWGNDFRPAYLNCSVLRELAPETPMIALTATATKKVADDIVSNLNMPDAVTFKDSFLRKNITYKVLREEDKRYRLKQLCSTNDGSAIVYVRTRRLAEQLADFLNTHNCSSAYFHGGITKKEKEKKLRAWLEDEVRIMVATNAFGMGIDKPKVRLVVHFQLPDSIENYFQEAGRAGRDHEPAEAILLTNTADEVSVRNQFLTLLPDIAFLKLVYRKLSTYFQISYGEGQQQTFPLQFNEFCDIYHLNPILAYNGLRLLDQNSVIALSQNFNKKTTVRFIASKKQLFDYLDNHQRIAPTIQTILRTYGGIFDYETKINTLLLSKKTNTSEENVINTLEQLQKDNIIEYDARHSDLEVTFLVPREDDSTVNRFADKVKAQQKLKIMNLDSMLAYIRNTSVCRSKQLLHYFGEALKKDCGTCDICIARNHLENAPDRIQDDILALLHHKQQSSRAIIAQLPYDQKTILEGLQLLLESGCIGIGPKNHYFKYTK